MATKSLSSSVSWQKGLDFLQCEHAVLGGAMSWISEHNLVSAISNAGGFGVIACGGMSPEMLEETIKSTQKLTSNSFGVNLIVMHPQLSSLVDVCIDNGITHIVLAGGLPPAEIISKIKSAKRKVLSLPPTLGIAKTYDKEWRGCTNNRGF